MKQELKEKLEKYKLPLTREKTVSIKCDPSGGNFLQWVNNIWEQAGDIEPSKLILYISSGYDGDGPDIEFSEEVEISEEEAIQEIQYYEERKANEKQREQKIRVDIEKHERETYLRLKKKYETRATS